MRQSTDLPPHHVPQLAEHPGVSPSRASSSAGPGNCPNKRHGPPSPARTPTSASLPPARKAGWALHCRWDRGRPQQHSGPGETASPQTTQGCCRRGRNKPCAEPFPPQKRTGGASNGMGQSKAEVKRAHGDGEVPLHTFSANSWQQKKWRGPKMEVIRWLRKTNKGCCLRREGKKANAGKQRPTYRREELARQDGDAGSAGPCGVAEAAAPQGFSWGREAGCHGAEGTAGPSTGGEHLPFRPLCGLR